MEQIKDTRWLRASFLTQGRHYQDRNRYVKGRGYMKFMDTTLGGNTVINPPYQFCRYADIKERRLVPDVGRGMGRWYSRNIDDWGHNVHFRMGVPAYSGLLSYAWQSVNGPAARYVATGREPGYLSTLGKIAGWVVSAAFWEVTVLTAFVSSLIDLTHSRFYYLKPTMYQYWRTVQTILDTLAGNLGLSVHNVPELDKIDKRHGSLGIAGGIEGDRGLIKKLKESMPDTFKTTIGIDEASMGIDIHAVAGRAQALQVRWQDQLTKLLDDLKGENISEEKLAQYIENAMLGSEIATGNNNGLLRPNLTNSTLSAYAKSMSQSSWFSATIDENTQGTTYSEQITSVLNKTTEAGSLASWFENTVDSFTHFADTKQNSQQKSSLAEKLIAEFRDGSQWCSFRVTNATDSVGESFSNSSEDSDIKNIFNQMSQTIRGAKFNLGNGVTGIGPLDNVVGAVTGGIGDFLTETAATSFQFTNPIIGLLYGSQIDIPKRWSNSSASLPSTTFKIELRCGYGNVMSYYQDILVPLSMLIGMTLPRGTGHQSYGSPFYIQYYSKGRAQVKIGLVSSLQITRGVGNAPWHKRGWPMGVDVTLTVEDMTSIMFSPIAAGLETIGPGGGTKLFTSPIAENAMGDYLAVLSALGMNEQEYFLPKLKRKLNSAIINFNGWLSPHKWAGWARDTSVDNILSVIANETSIR